VHKEKVQILSIPMSVYEVNDEDIID